MGDIDCKFDAFDLQDLADLRNPKRPSRENVFFQADELVVENVSPKISRTDQRNSVIHNEYIYKDIGIVKCIDIVQMKELLDQTINVKIKYENIIKKLVSEPESRDRTLKII